MRWAWVLSSSRLWGRRVVAEGYLDFEDTRRETVPLRWLSERQIEVRFRQGRRSDIGVIHTCAVQ